MSPQEQEQQQSVMIANDKDNNMEESSSKEVPSLTATTEMCAFCFRLLMHELITREHIFGHLDDSLPSPPTTWQDSNNNNNELQKPSPSPSCPLFVTWEKRRNNNSASNEFQLRGCIGTLSPKPLTGPTLKKYTQLAAFHDQRFDPIKYKELEQLRVCVSLLVQYEECSSVYDWQVGRHGIILQFLHNRDNYSATYLPEVAQEQGWDQKETIQSLARKAGYRGVIDDGLRSKMKCTRYQSSKIRLTFQEFIQQFHNGIHPLAQQKQRDASCVQM